MSRPPVPPAPLPPPPPPPPTRQWNADSSYGAPSVPYSSRGYDSGYPRDFYRRDDRPPVPDFRAWDQPPRAPLLPPIPPRTPGALGDQYRRNDLYRRDPVPYDSRPPPRHDAGYRREDSYWSASSAPHPAYLSEGGVDQPPLRRDEPYRREYPSYPSRGYDNQSSPVSRGYPSAQPLPPRSEDQLRELRSPTNTVFLGGAGVNNLTDSQLYQVFGQFGKVMKVSNQRARQTGQLCIFVHFRRIEEADRSIRALYERRALGPEVKYNFGKMFEYTQEEMDMAYDPRRDNVPPPPRRPGGDGDRFAREGNRDDEFSRKRRRDDDRDYRDTEMPQRRIETANPPRSEVLFLGGVSDDISNQDIRDFFASFNVVNVTRNDRKKLAFVHFSDEKESTKALEVMMNATLKGSRVKMNYGTARKTREEYADMHGFNPREERLPREPKEPEPVYEEYDPSSNKEFETNVIFFSLLPPNTTEAEISALLAPYKGCISIKVIPDKKCAFGHFDTRQSAKVVRLFLKNPTVRGHTVRVQFGKDDHYIPLPTPESRQGDTVTEYATHNQTHSLDHLLGSGVGPDGIPELILPILKPANDDSMLQPASLNPLSGGFTLEERVSIIMMAPYRTPSSGDTVMSQETVDRFIAAVDVTRDEGSSAVIGVTLEGFLPSQATQCAAVMLKRLKEKYENESNKKLWVLYRFVTAVLSVKTSLLTYNKDAIETLLALVLVVSEHQSKEGIAQIKKVLQLLKDNFFVEISPHYKDSAFNARCIALVDKLCDMMDAKEEFEKLLMKAKNKS